MLSLLKCILFHLRGFLRSQCKFGGVIKRPIVSRIISISILWLTVGFLRRIFYHTETVWCFDYHMGTIFTTYAPHDPHVCCTCIFSRPPKLYVWCNVEDQRSVGVGHFRWSLKMAYIFFSDG